MSSEVKKDIKGPSTVGEWEAEIKNTDSKDLATYRMALSTLREWQAFKDSFAWTRMFHLITFIQTEQEDRQRIPGRKK